MAQQDKIIGYFLDEAQEHLRVIEERLISPHLLSEAAHIKEAFRAAHSIKGGAAMLELDTIQQIGHHFEQAFKQIKEKSLSVDESLQNLLLEGFEILSLALQILRHQQSPPASLAQEEVFGKIQSYFGSYEQGASNLDNNDFLPNLAIEKAFGSYVNHNLRQFDSLCSKPQADSITRAALSDICQKIGELGKDFDFIAWTNLLTSCQIAMNNPLIQMDKLRKTIPPAIKQAQLLVINGNHHAITNSPELNELLATENRTDLTVTPTDENFDMSENSLWSDETSLDEGKPINTWPTAANKYNDVSADSIIDSFNQENSIEKSAESYDLGEFMQLFDEEITADGTWVQDEDVLAFDNAHKSSHAEENRQSSTLWDEDIFERPLPVLNLDLDAPNSSLAHSTELKPIVNLPQFNFEEPGNSELFMEDDVKTDCPVIHPNTLSLNSFNGQEIDWSGLLANIPDEAIVDYQEPLASSPKIDEWSLPSISNNSDPAISINNTYVQPEAPFSLTNVEEKNAPEKLFDLEEKEEESEELSTFNSEQPIVTDFAVENSLAQKDSSILDTDNFHQFTAEKSINREEDNLTQDQHNLILDFFEFEDDQFTFDFSSQPSTDLEISNIFSVDPQPIVNASALPTLDELMSKSLNMPPPQSKPISSNPEEWRELSMFDDLLADTQTTDADITDLNQIMINGNLDPELELENLEDLSDFLQASVSSDQIDALDSLVRAN
jgi:chemotaxis protein histidine kinase CheA